MIAGSADAVDRCRARPRPACARAIWDRRRGRSTRATPTRAEVYIPQPSERELRTAGTDLLDGCDLDRFTRFTVQTTARARGRGRLRSPAAAWPIAVDALRRRARCAWH